MSLPMLRRTKDSSKVSNTGQRKRVSECGNRHESWPLCSLKHWCFEKYHKYMDFCQWSSQPLPLLVCCTICMCVLSLWHAHMHSDITVMWFTYVLYYMHVCVKSVACTYAQWYHCNVIYLCVVPYACVLKGGLHLKPLKFEHKFVAVITPPPPPPLLLCK